MQQLIASFLFQNKTCPLPGLGTLSVINKPSQSDFVHKLILAPVPVIHFSEATSDVTDLINYISIKKGYSYDEAATALSDISQELKNGKEIEQVGSFSTDTFKKIIFTGKRTPGYFTPAVTSERVIHPEANHNILVGDKETTASVMTEYYAEEAPKKDRWWAWAIVLAAIAIAVIVIYLYDKNSSASFGNAVDHTLS